MGKFDNIFDDVVINAKAAASAVSKKASTVYDTSKYKITAAEIRGEISKKLRDLGKYTYKSQVHGVDLSAEIAATIEEIKELKENLDVINVHLEAVKTSKKCPHCDARVPKNSVYCNICGEKIEEEPGELDFVEAEAQEEADQKVSEEEAEAPVDFADAEENADLF